MFRIHRRQIMHIRPRIYLRSVYDPIKITLPMQKTSIPLAVPVCIKGAVRISESKRPKISTMTIPYSRPAIRQSLRPLTRPSR